MRGDGSDVEKRGVFSSSTGSPPPRTPTRAVRRRIRRCPVASARGSQDSSTQPPTSSELNGTE
jgi:hypothetical protein